MKKRVLSLLLCLVMALGLTACTGQVERMEDSPAPDASPSESAAPTESAVPSESAAPSDDTHETQVEKVRLAVLTGAACVGAAKLMDANERGACRNFYDVTLAADSGEAAAGLLSGELDLAAVDSGAAAILYRQTGGGVQLLCLSAPDLADEWNEVTADSARAVGAVVVRTGFAQERPEAVAAFLEDYRESVAYVSSSGTQAAALAEQYGIVSADAAGQAVTDGGLACITGEEMRSRIQDCFEALYADDPASLGGGIPDDGFYYGVE